MTFILTCGCEYEHDGYFCEWDTETRECEPAIAYGCLCAKHYAEYGQGQRRKNNTNADELADLIEFDAPIMGLNKEAATMLRQQQVDLKIADDYSYILERKLKEAQAEIEALKAKLNKYHLKEDLVRNLDLIYGKEFIK